MASGMDTGDTAWLLVSTALVLLMTPALGLFYAGLVRAKNVLNTFMMSVASLGVGIAWVLVGYSVAFSHGVGFAGGLHNAFLRGIGLHARPGPLFGDALQLGRQALAVAGTVGFAFGATWLLLKAMALVAPLRASERDEGVGMDVTQHGEEAYSSGEGAPLLRPFGHD